MANKYFERIPRGPKDAPDVVTLEVKQLAEKRMYAEAETNPQVDIIWHTVPFRHKDSYALDILAPDAFDSHGPALQRAGAGQRSGDRGLCGPGFPQMGRSTSTSGAKLGKATRRRKWNTGFTPNWRS